MSESKKDAAETNEAEAPRLREKPKAEAPRVKITKLTEELDLSEDAADQPCWG